MVTIIAASILLSESRADDPPKLDLVGVLLLTIGLGLFSYPFMEGQERGWRLWAWYCLLASFPVFWAFFLFERRQSARRQSPLLEPKLFKTPDLWLACWSPASISRVIHRCC